MIKVLSSLWSFLSYWYFRYLLATELYMVEKWERAVVNFTFFLVFVLLSVFNYKVINYVTSPLVNYMTV